MIEDDKQLTFEPVTPLIIEAARHIESVLEYEMVNSGRGNWFPVGLHVVQAHVRLLLYLALSLPVIVASVGLGSLTVGPGELFLSVDTSLSYLWTLALELTTRPYLVALAVVAVYIPGLLGYVPYDRRQHTNGVTPQLPLRWEGSMMKLSIVTLPAVYYLLVAFGPAGLGKSVLLAASVGGSLAVMAVYSWWIRFRYQDFYDDRYRPPREVLKVFLAFYVFYLGCVLFIHFGLVSFLFGDVGVEKPMWVVLMWVMFWFVSDTRTMLREELYGLVHVEPLYTKLWLFISRIPFLFAVVLVALGADVAGAMRLLYLSPVIALLLYYVYRYRITGNMMAMRNDGSVPGNLVWEEKREVRNAYLNTRFMIRGGIAMMNRLLDAHSTDCSKLPRMSRTTGEELKERVESIHERAGPELRQKEKYKRAHAVLIDNVEKWIDTYGTEESGS